MNLSQNNIGSVGCTDFCETSLENSVIKKIDLSKNRLADRDVSSLAAMLRENDSLEELDLSHNGFSVKYGNVLRPALAENPSLTKLDLSWNKINHKSAEKIFHGLKMFTVEKKAVDYIDWMKDRQNVIQQLNGSGMDVSTPAFIL